MKQKDFEKIIDETTNEIENIIDDLVFSKNIERVINDLKELKLTLEKLKRKRKENKTR